MLALFSHRRKYLYFFYNSVDRLRTPAYSGCRRSKNLPAVGSCPNDLIPIAVDAMAADACCPDAI